MALSLGQRTRPEPVATLIDVNRSARIGGGLYLVIIIAGIVGPLLTREQLVVPHDAVATAHNIAASPGLWRLGIALNVVMQLCDVPVMLILFLLLSPVNRNLARLALLFNIVQTATLVANQLTLVATGLLAPDQPALADVALRTYSFGEPLGLVFFGFTCVLEGYLIRHSGYLPWILGTLMQIAGIAYVANSFLLLLAPEVTSILFLLPTVVAELSFALWLVARGVDVARFPDAATEATAQGRGKSGVRP